MEGESQQQGSMQENRTNEYGKYFVKKKAEMAGT